jgi:REP element-mobilizing transposase RayT
MKLIANCVYHLYNQGNNQEIIFRKREDYLRFLQKYRAIVAPYCHTLNYCLMPNRFHFLIDTTEKSVEKIQLGGIQLHKLTDCFRKLLSEYAREINEKYHRTGSLFRQKTKAKLTVTTDPDYTFACFHYIHQNPYRAKLVAKMEDWEFSSFQDYINIRKGTLCRQELAKQRMEIHSETLYQDSYRVIPEAVIQKLF